VQNFNFKFLVNIVPFQMYISLIDF
jgi:hypothetical protein